MDVKSAFMHGDLQEEIYMEQPPGYVQNDSILVCHPKLMKITQILVDFLPFYQQDFKECMVCGQWGISKYDISPAVILYLNVYVFTIIRDC
jgi:hypothetical protein